MLLSIAGGESTAWPMRGVWRGSSRESRKGIKTNFKVWTAEASLETGWGSSCPPRSLRCECPSSETE